MRGGPSWKAGRVEIFHNGQWGTVCDDGFDVAAARVACWDAGLRGGRALVNTEYGEGTGPIWIDDINCEGTEMWLSSCQRPKYGKHNCFHFEDAGVQCSGALTLRITSIKFMHVCISFKMWMILLL